MNNKTLETALLYLSGGCLVISILEIITRGIGFGYLWLMICVALWLGHIVVKRKRLADNGEPDANVTSIRKTKAGTGAVSNKTTASKSKRKRR